MRTMIDIPDPIYRELKERAAREGTSIDQLILRRVADPSVAHSESDPNQIVTYPLVSSRQPGSMKLGKEGVYEYIPFP